MAINSFEKTCDKIEIKYSSNNSGEKLPPSKLHELSMFSDDNLSSSDSRSSKIKKGANGKSPYLTNNNVQLHSRAKEKKVAHKRAINIVSSFPLATNIYKANSDEFKSQKKDFRKVKKSVLTLPNEPACVPRVCTVSDMNDSECSSSRDGNKKMKMKRRFQALKGKTRIRNKDYEFYDRDARFCSQMNIDLNCSSTDIIKFTGDCKRGSNKYRSQNKLQTENNLKPHDVWAVLRNMNRFQFQPSPPMSDDDSIQTPVKKRRNKRRSNIKDRGVIETCRTEEFSIISSFDFQSKSPSFSQSSSFDRITVIDKQEEVTQSVSQIRHELERTGNKRNNLKGRTKRLPVIRNQNKNILKSNTKAISTREPRYQLQSGESNKIDKVKAESIRKQSDLKETSRNNKITYDLIHEVAAIAPGKNEDYKQNDTENDNEVTDEFKTFEESPVRVIPSRLQDRFCKLAIKDDVDSIDVPMPTDQQLKGITKVILSKQNVTGAKHNEVQMRKPRLLTTMPSSIIMPRLTTAEIKRQIAKMKFPIVILGKDQLGVTSIRVAKYEHPQFEGLEQRIWPFMHDWYQNNLPTKECFSEKKMKTAEQVAERKPVSKNKLNIQQKDNKALSRNTKTEIVDYKPDPESTKYSTESTKYSNLTKNEPETNKNKFWKRSVPTYELRQNKQQYQKKPKPVQQLQDTMLRFLYKKMSVKSLDEQFRASRNISGTKDIPIPVTEIKTPQNYEKIDVSTKTMKKSDRVTLSLPKTSSIKVSTEANKLPAITKQFCTKGKWASEFIENIIRKVRNGVYYNQENINLKKTLPLCSKEVSIQTLLTGKDICKDVFIENKGTKDVDDKFSHLEAYVDHTSNVLPGFDKSPPELEIKTMNVKEISIRHCTSNVTVQFDVTHLLETEYRNRPSSSLIPLAVNENHTKIFKCKTTILNAALPAELCSIIPTVLKIIVDSTKLPSLPMIKPYQKASNLYTITELNRNENLDFPKGALFTSIGLSPVIKKLFVGTYPDKITGTEITKMNKLLKFENLRDFNIKNVLPMSKCIQKLLPLKVCPLNFIRFKPLEMKGDKKNPPCTALQLYKAPEQHIKTFENMKTVPFGKCTINNLLKQMWNQNLIIRFKISMPLSLGFENNDNFVSIQIMSEQIVRKEESTTSISDIKINSLYHVYLQQNEIGVERNTKTETSMKMILDKNHLTEQNVIKKDSQGYLSCNKKRKTRFVKLYKKCKSTSNISGERFSTSLNKINNLDDFFQALGLGKIMSSVFDGNIGKKILSSVSEMQNWITGISQRQAMLLLLLTNKKDTPNLLRFRPLLLQAIAVNRITRASELDMEIDVIERENFNRFSKFEGIPYKIKTADHPDTLLEELYWIAKTTASDYQKPFNESSEKLLKSLLEKRKNQNPSYLRVMARYVGLGLLKTPRKKQI